jgi:hypothetical protein
MVFRIDLGSIRMDLWARGWMPDAVSDGVATMLMV